MITKKEFYFVRHGQAEYKWISESEQYDAPLTLLGIQQAEKIKPLISSLPIKTVCFSPLKRVKETKDIIIENLSTKQCEMMQLQECSLQIWQEMTQLGSLAFQNGNQLVRIFMQQAIIGINLALQEEGPILIIAHGGIHWALCCLMNADHEWMIDNCIPVHFFYDENQWIAKKLI